MSQEVTTALAEKFARAMDAATDGFSKLLWIDFPDYENVGDSAIWLGSRAWARKAGKETVAILPNRAVSEDAIRRYVDQNTAVVFQGGGNFGGLYSDHDRARIETARASQDLRLIQAPQSVHFADAGLKEQLRNALVDVSDLRLLVRDEASFTAVSGWGEVALAPDAAHFLGPLSGPAAELPYVALLRTDKESAIAGSKFGSAVYDWSDRDVRGRRVRQLRAELSRRMNSGVWIRGIDYDSVAHERLVVGLELLSRGEVVVTDRLHAMILGLQLGRRVIAVDNKIGKLSRYATAWFNDISDDRLVFCGSVEHAIALAENDI